MYAGEYKQRGLRPTLLSSALESGGTITSPLIPWSTCGVYMSGVLGIAVWDYAPFAIFNVVMPMVMIALVAFEKNKYFIEKPSDTP